MAQVLLIEDDVVIRTRLVRALGELGHSVGSAATAMSGLEQAALSGPDLVVLDLGLPDLDGQKVLQMLRAVSSVPVIVATALDSEQDVVTLLNDGADDYLTKPFTAAQLDARIRAVLRRVGTDQVRGPVVLGGLQLDRVTREVSLDGEQLTLTPREFDLLYYLAERANQVVTKRELLTEVWQLPYGGADKTVDVHLAWLRRKLGETAASPRYVQTVRGVGVKLVAPRETTEDAD